MKTLFSAILSFFALFACDLSAQNKPYTPTPLQLKYRQTDTTPVLGEVKANKERLSIDFKVPYDGIVEVKIYNPDTVNIYHENVPCFLGTNTVRVKFNKTTTGTYIFTLEYKGHMIKSYFVMP